MKKTDILKNRYFLIIAFFIIAAAAMIIKLYDMQIINGEEYSAKSFRKVTHTFEINAARGLIADRNGLLLAYNRESNDIYMTKAYSTSKELNEALLRLFDILEKNNENFHHSFDTYILRDPVVFNPNRETKEIIKWQTDKDIFDIPEKDIKTSAKELIAYLREKFEIEEKYSKEEAYKILCMRYEIVKQRWNYVMGGHIQIAEDVSLSTVALISEQRHYLRGILIQTKMVREYGDVYDVAHVLGYVGNISAEELSRFTGYDGNDIIGKSGMEEYAESYLRGTDGYLEVEADMSGRFLERIGGTDEVNGNDITLTIDMELQKVAMKAMEETIADIVEKQDGEINFGDASAGATVVMDVNTGEILVLASYPSYDPKWFIYDDEYSQKQRLNAIFDTAGTPTWNRAIQGVYTPGSIFKPIVAIAALESDEHNYNRESTILCDGKATIANWDFYCHEYREYGITHGEITIAKAIEVSCNLVFSKLGIDIGIDKIDSWAKKLGFGKITGIDLYGEEDGIRSNREYKYTVFDQKWWPADTGQTSIGQLYNNFTPIQLAVYTAALANGGKKLTPYLIKKITDPDGNTILKTETEYEQIEWSDETYDIIRGGMSSVTLEGTARKVFDNYPISVAGKTGTAETGRESKESSNALFICYAPVDNPQIVIVTVIENGVWGSFTAPVAKKILSAYFDVDEGEEQ